MLASTYIPMQVHLLVFLPAIFLILLHYYKAGKPSGPVYDTEGNELNSGEEYYILPSNRSRPGGGLILSQHNTSWPLSVAQDIFQLNDGNAVTIVPVTDNLLAEKVVGLSSDVQIKFVSCAVCLEAMVWRIGDREGANSRRFVVAGDIRADAGNNDSRFRIEKNENGGYRFVYCPKVCKLCRSECENVGVFIEDRKRWLGLDGLPLAVAFKKSTLSYNV